MNDRYLIEKPLEGISHHNPGSTHQGGIGVGRKLITGTDMGQCMSIINAGGINRCRPSERANPFREYPTLERQRIGRLKAEMQGERLLIGATATHQEKQHNYN
jgi:hypothetical protein